MDFIEKAFKESKIVNLSETGVHYCVNQLTDHIPATDAKFLSQIVDEALDILEPIKNKYSLIVGEEDRGGYIASLIAFHLGIPFTLIKWNPDGVEGDIYVDFKNLYTGGKMYVNSIKENDSVLIVEDIIDTGGTIVAINNITDKYKAKVVDIFSVANKEGYGGLEKIENKTGIKPRFLISFNTENSKCNITSRYKMKDKSFEEEQYVKKQDFYKNHEKLGGTVFEKFFEKIDELDLKDKKVLDFGCGVGNDLRRIKELGGITYGVDINQEAIEQAKESLPKGIFKIEDIRKTSFEDNYFDLITSNYVLQSIDDINTAYTEILRLLKPGGICIFTATHPMRHYFERKKYNSDYFKQEIVDSIILDGSVVVQEPTHTMNEFISEFLLSNFDIEYFKEIYDPLAEAVQGRKYPGFLLIKIKKKGL